MGYTKKQREIIDVLMTDGGAYLRQARKDWSLYSCGHHVARIGWPTFEAITPEMRQVRLSDTGWPGSSEVVWVHKANAAINQHVEGV